MMVIFYFNKYGLIDLCQMLYPLLFICNLSSMNNSSFMIFEHKDLGTASAHNYLIGWKATFSKLEKLLSS